MTYWEGPARWINTVLLVIVGFIGLHTLFRLLEANPDNAIVAFVAAVAGVFLAPFRNMFSDQQYLLTALIALIGWSLFAGLILVILRALGVGERHVYRRETPVDSPVDPDRTHRL